MAIKKSDIPVIENQLNSKILNIAQMVIDERLRTEWPKVAMTSSPQVVITLKMLNNAIGVELEASTIETLINMYIESGWQVELITKSTASQDILIFS